MERAAVIRLHNHLNRMDEIKKIGETTYSITNIERVGAVREESRQKREPRSDADRVTLGRKGKRGEKGAAEDDATDRSEADDEAPGGERHINIVI